MKFYTDPLLDIQSFYKNKNILEVISGEGTIEEVVSQMKDFLALKLLK